MDPTILSPEIEAVTSGITGAASTFALEAEVAVLVSGTKFDATTDTRK